MTHPLEILNKNFKIIHSIYICNLYGNGRHRNFNASIIKCYNKKLVQKNLKAKNYRLR